MFISGIFSLSVLLNTARDRKGPQGKLRRVRFRVRVRVSVCLLYVWTLFTLCSFVVFWV